MSRKARQRNVDRVEAEKLGINMLQLRALRVARQFPGQDVMVNDYILFLWDGQEHNVSQSIKSLGILEWIDRRRAAKRINVNLW